jgi:hypothetical protein
MKCQLTETQCVLVDKAAVRQKETNMTSPPDSNNPDPNKSSLDQFLRILDGVVREPVDFTNATQQQMQEIVRGLDKELLSARSEILDLADIIGAMNNEIEKMNAELCDLKGVPTRVILCGKARKWRDIHTQGGER